MARKCMYCAPIPSRNQETFSFETKIIDRVRFLAQIGHSSGARSTQQATDSVCPSIRVKGLSSEDCPPRWVSTAGRGGNPFHSLRHDGAGILDCCQLLHDD